MLKPSPTVSLPGLYPGDYPGGATTADEIVEDFKGGPAQGGALVEVERRLVLDANILIRAVLGRRANSAACRTSPTSSRIACLNLCGLVRDVPSGVIAPAARGAIAFWVTYLPERPSGVDIPSMPARSRSSTHTSPTANCRTANSMPSTATAWPSASGSRSAQRRPRAQLEYRLVTHAWP
jgi:hypothetical protein